MCLQETHTMKSTAITQVTNRDYYEILVQNLLIHNIFTFNSNRHFSKNIILKKYITNDQLILVIMLGI